MHIGSITLYSQQKMSIIISLLFVFLQTEDEGICYYLLPYCRVSGILHRRKWTNYER